MEKILQKHKRLCLISAVVELLLLLTILLLILFKVENNIFQLITAIIISAIVVFNFAFEMIFNVIINRRKDAIELSSIELVESNEDKAYVFGGIGIIITGKNHYIRWVNTYIRMNFPSIIDKNIMDVFPDIKKLIEEIQQQTSKINICFSFKKLISYVSVPPSSNSYFDISFDFMSEIFEFIKPYIIKTQNDIFYSSIIIKLFVNLFLLFQLNQMQIYVASILNFTKNYSLKLF